MGPGGEVDGGGGPRPALDAEGGKRRQAGRGRCSCLADPAELDQGGELRRLTGLAGLEADLGKGFGQGCEQPRPAPQLDAGMDAHHLHAAHRNA